MKNTGFGAFVIFVHMTSALTSHQRNHGIMRLTALWAFTESGVGGIMHALQIPFTGLFVGGMAVLMICLIAQFSNHRYKLILKSALIVLIIKAMASPFTPLTAYLAVSFQAALAYAVISIAGINFISVLLISVVAMFESALQKLLVLTTFFGQSFWKATDNMIAFAGTQTGYHIANGSYWVMGIYLAIYLAGGIVIAWISYKIIRNVKLLESLSTAAKQVPVLPVTPVYTSNSNQKRQRKILAFTIVMVAVSLVLFIFSADKKSGWLEVIKAISWTIAALLAWFVLIGPLLTTLLQQLLKRKQSRYQDEVLQTIALFPMLKALTISSWQSSHTAQGFKRWHLFLSSLIYSTLTYSSLPVNEEPVK